MKEVQAEYKNGTNRSMKPAAKKNCQKRIIRISMHCFTCYILVLGSHTSNQFDKNFCYPNVTLCIDISMPVKWADWSRKNSIKMQETQKIKLN